MVKPNYAAWNFDETSYKVDWSLKQKIKFLIKYAVLAPSGHNTQPWVFLVADETVVISEDPERHLPHSGTSAAEPYVSIGSATETFLQAANGLGLKFNVKTPLKSGELVRLEYAGQTTPSHDINKSIRARSSNRFPYKEKQIPEDKLDKILGLKLDGVDVRYFNKKAELEYFATKTALATTEIVSDPKFRKELSRWVRNNNTNKYDGMPGFTQGMPLPPSLIAKHVIQNFNIGKGQAKTDSKRIMSSAGLLLISVKQRDAKSLTNAGRMYAFIGIHATLNGLATSGVGAAVINPSTRDEIASNFNLNYSPLALMRIGYKTKEARHTPRWPAEEVIREN